MGGVKMKQAPEFTEMLLRSIELDVDTLFKYAVWKKLVSNINEEDRKKRAKFMRDAFEKELLKWFNKKDLEVTP